jgi:flagellar biosynthesis/type III secretory pathway chaperone
MIQSGAGTHLDQAALLLGLLEREQHLLRNGDADALPALCRDKLASLSRLAALLNQLKNPAALDAAQRKALRELVLRCQQQSQANEELLNARLNQARNVLLARRGPAAHYDPRGRGRYESKPSLHGMA